MMSIAIDKPMRIVVTGADGLLGWHSRVHLHAKNCAAKFRSEPIPYDIVAIGNKSFNNSNELEAALNGADAVLHFAGVNRAPDLEIEQANPDIALRLTSACNKLGSSPHIVYANSTHAETDTPYGRSKSKAGKIFESFSHQYTDLVLPHIFGECAKPFYNNVTATLVQQLIGGEEPTINPDGKVSLMHAGTAAELAIDSVTQGDFGEIRPDSFEISVQDLYDKLHKMHSLYNTNMFPEVSNNFDRDLFNAYRNATFPAAWPRQLEIHEDSRGKLFEAVKGGSGGQTFLSTTAPGVTRGDHFHLRKMERFLVVKGEAVIRVRKALQGEVHEFRVTGDNPTPVDMPTLHTHSIENIGDSDLLTLFWAHELFDNKNPDTFADKVIVREA